MNQNLSNDTTQKIAEVIARYPQKQAALLPILHLIQEEQGYIPEELEAAIAEMVEVPVIKVREVLSFYTLFNRHPIGKYHVQLCRTISCTLCGQRDLLQHIKTKLGIEVGQTTADGKFTLSEVECLAACETAPMMQINDTYYGNLTRERIDEILASLQAEER
ncbi:MAG: NADH-quinone oxidoreductase subunit NuoE [candidate division KSB1 bacterium]|nr:NADH-quinone oxidoreductase subunit NuoE [candidate division KSB1 bacterium]